MKRKNNRENDEIRGVKMDTGYLEHPDGSCIIEMGKTKIICAASIQDGIPRFLQGEDMGWLTAEYEMLPHAAEERGIREASRRKRKGRSQEIQRIIGRVLRGVVKLGRLGERTIWIDCDVIQADGGTRTASITGGFVALYQAFEEMMKEGIYSDIPIKEFVAAVSVGVVDGETRLDLEYEEDSTAAIDLNLAMTEDGRIVEIQGTGEEHPFEKENLNKLIELGYKGIKELINRQKEVLGL